MVIVMCMKSAQDELIQKLLLKYMQQEVEATLDPVDGISVAEYESSLIERFANPNIADTLQRICEFTSDRIPVFNLQAVSEQINTGVSLKLSALIIASWRAYLDGVSENGDKIDIVDNKKDFLEMTKKGRVHVVNNYSINLMLKNYHDVWNN